MKIKLSPNGDMKSLSVVKAGEVLVINGVSYDFSRLADGDTLPMAAAGNEFFASSIERIDGVLTLSLMLPHVVDAPESVRFPGDLINPPDGPLSLPGHEHIEYLPVSAGVMDWSQIITAEAKAQAAAEQHLAQVHAEMAARRTDADRAIAPLQDAVDLDEATAEEAAELLAWKRYRVALNRLPDQPGYPNEITWPVPPA
ncbi:tail fiber assembly protein [Pseudomonas guariconensis]|uniref:tail fiber assembly protein n=1 Tax=Pseudomonas guariconensis TaxID=1288410 RepID=UPI002D7831DA|nr:tail fiber assembly protein [Pseudomonas guariconensis]